MANNFNYYSPTEVVFGKGTHAQTGAYVKKYGGTKLLIVYGSDRVLKNGVMDAVTESVKTEGITYELLGGVVPNQHLSKVYEGIELGKKMEADIVGSETSNSCVITKADTKDKRAYDDDISRPKFAIMNPELTMSLPDYQTECGCADIMMHTMERYFTNGGNMELTDAIAEGLLRTVMTYAKILHTDPENYEARAEVMWAGSLAHNNLTGCGNDGGDFATHMLEHEMGGMFDVTHGAGLAAIWPSWARYVCKDALPRFERYARNVMGVTGEGTDEEIAEKGIQAMESFYREINMPTNMQELGIKPTDAQMREMAKRCAVACGGSQGSAKVLHEEDMYEIYKLSQ